MVDLVEPVSVEQAKARLGIRTAERDDEIARLIPAARGHVETLSQHFLVRREVTQSFARFPCDGGGIRLFGAPIVSLVKVEYQDSAGAIVEVPGVGLSPYQAGVVFPAGMDFWPYGPIGRAGGQVTFVAGFADGEAPAELVQALLLLVSHWFENHEAVVVGTSAVELPLGVHDLVRDFREAGFS